MFVSSSLRQARASGASSALVIVIFLFLVVAGHPQPCSAGTPSPDRSRAAQTLANSQGLELAGTVVDPQGRPLADATVTVAHPANAHTTAKPLVRSTDERGRFSVRGLAPGAYQVVVKVSGFRTETRPVDLSSSTTTMTIVLSLETIEQRVTVTAPPRAGEQMVAGRTLSSANGQDVAAALDQVPGVSAMRRGSINEDPLIRGLSETELGAFVDGTRTFAAGPARMDSGISHASPHDVEHVRIVKGPYALTSGAGAMSAIEVETFQPPFYPSWQTHGEAGVSYGANANAPDTYATLWTGSRRLSFGLFDEWQVGHDYTAGNGDVIPGHYQSNTTHWIVRAKPSDGTGFSYSGGYQDQEGLDYPGRLLDATYLKTQSHNFKLIWNPAASPVSSLVAQFYLNRKGHLMNNDDKPTAQPMVGRVPPFGLTIAVPATSNTLGGKLQALVGRGALTAQIGTDFYHLYQNADRTISRRDTSMTLFRDIVWPQATQDDQGVYGQLAWQRGTIGITGTLRTDLVQTAAGTVSDFFQSHTTGPLDQHETNVSAAASLKWNASRALQVYASVGRAVRTATILERYSDRFQATTFQTSAEFMGDPSLEPEASLEFDGGTTLHYLGVQLNADGFYRRMSHYIDFVPDPSLPKELPLDPPLVFRYINGTTARFVGGELSAQRPLAAFVDLRASLDDIWGQDDFLHEPVYGLEPLRGRVGLDWHDLQGTWTLSTEALMVNEQTRVAVSRFERPTPGYTVINLRGRYRTGAGVTLAAGVNNLGDREYTDHLDAVDPFTGEQIPEMGRNLWVQTEYTF
jgi:iron complex outermembrane receptor protein